MESQFGDYFVEKKEKYLQFPHFFLPDLCEN